MAVLRIFQGKLKKEIVFEKESSPLLAELLSAHNILQEHPCGGHGICGKCAVRIREAAESPAAGGQVTESPAAGNAAAGNAAAGSQAEKAGHSGVREVLSCRYRLTGDCDVFLPAEEGRWAIETSMAAAEARRAIEGSTAAEETRQAVAGSPVPDRTGAAPLRTGSGSDTGMNTGTGAAVDIGTTTVVLNLYDLASGALLSTAAMPNPQRSISADIMGRIRAAMDGKLADMQQMIAACIRSLLEESVASAVHGLSPESVSSAVITGNTAMLCLLTGTDPSSMAKAPFSMPDCFGKETGLFPEFGSVYLPRCMHAFVGADTVCAVLSSRMTEETVPVLLADIGTNGELALWKNGKLYVTSTAAGPAFEGAGITCGCGSIEGAIDHVEIYGGQPVIHTIGGKKACGLCGSGLIDAAAAGLKLGLISETGAMEKPFPLKDGIALYPEDVRSLQLAKAAVCAGIRTLLDVSGTKLREVKQLYIAGGFGSRLNTEAAGTIGLIPEELADLALPLGNAALKGASLLLSHPELRAEEKRIAGRCEHVNLGGNPLFNSYYMDSMLFGEE